MEIIPKEYNERVPSNFCIAPFTHVAIDSNGDFKPCCIAEPITSKKNNKPLNLNDITFEEGLLSEEYKTFRQKFINNERPKECEHCWKCDDQKVVSHRQRLMSFFMTGTWDSDGKTETFQMFKKLFDNKVEWNIIKKFLKDDMLPFNMEIEPGTTCNFRCHFCGPYASSSWIKEHNHLYDDPKANVWTKQGKWSLDNQLWSSQTMFDGYNFHFMGGEPMLIKPHFDFLKELSKTSHANDVRITYNTNGSTLPPREMLEDVYPKFREISVSFSFDDIKHRFNYQRYPGDWKQCVDNLIYWANNLENISIKIDPGWSILNMFYMDELFHWADKMHEEVYPIFKDRFENISRNWNIHGPTFSFDGHYYFGPFYCPKKLTDTQQDYAKCLLLEKRHKLDDINNEKIRNKAILTHQTLLDLLDVKDWDEETEKERNRRIRSLDLMRDQDLGSYMPEVDEMLRL